MTAIDDKQILLIIGSPRSGTTWLQLLLSAHEQVCTTTELTLFDRYISPWVDTWNDESRVIAEGRWARGLPFIWSEEEFYGFLREFVDRAYSSVLATNPSATHILDKRPRYSRHVPLINRLLPKAKFIHLIRDGRDTALSILEAKKSMGFGPDNMEAAAKVWRDFTTPAMAASQYEGRYFSLRYEDMCSDGAPVLKELFDFCGLPATDALIEQIISTHSFEKNKAARITPVRDSRCQAPEGHYRRGIVGAWRDELDSEQLEAFYSVAGDLMVQLGYIQADELAERPVS